MDYCFDADMWTQNIYRLNLTHHKGLDEWKMPKVDTLLWTGSEWPKDEALLLTIVSYPKNRIEKKRVKEKNPVIGNENT